MPDTKFSWRGLREHIRKFFWIYILGIVICLVGTNLLWTTTRPRVSIEHSVTVFLADGYSDPTPLADIARDMLERTQAFDDTLEQVEFQSMMYNENDYTSSMLLVTRLSVGEGDAFLANQAAMDALASSEALEPLDDHVAGGWLAEYGLEPYYATVENPDTGESTSFLAGLRLDSVDALAQMGAFNNEGAFLCVTNNGGNQETTMKALEYMLEDLTTEADDAATEATEPAA